MYEQDLKRKVQDRWLVLFFYLVRPHTFHLINNRAVKTSLNSMCLYINMQCTIFVTGMINCGKISLAKFYIYFVRVVHSLESCSFYTVIIFFRFMNGLYLTLLGHIYKSSIVVNLLKPSFAVEKKKLTRTWLHTYNPFFYICESFQSQCRN